MSVSVGNNNNVTTALIEASKSQTAAITKTSVPVKPPEPVNAVPKPASVVSLGQSTQQSLGLYNQSGAKEKEPSSTISDSKIFNSNSSKNLGVKASDSSSTQSSASTTDTEDSFAGSGQVAVNVMSVNSLGSAVANFDKPEHGKTADSVQIGFEDLSARSSKDFNNATISVRNKIPQITAPANTDTTPASATKSIPESDKSASPTPESAKKPVVAPVVIQNKTVEDIKPTTVPDNAVSDKKSTAEPTKSPETATDKTVTDQNSSPEPDKSASDKKTATEPAKVPTFAPVATPAKTIPGQKSASEPATKSVSDNKPTTDSAKEPVAHPLAFPIASQATTETEPKSAVKKSIVEPAKAPPIAAPVLTPAATVINQESDSNKKPITEPIKSPVAAPLLAPAKTITDDPKSTPDTNSVTEPTKTPVTIPIAAPAKTVTNPKSPSQPAANGGNQTQDNRSVLTDGTNPNQDMGKTNSPNLGKINPSFSIY